MGLQGTIRGKPIRTTVSDKAAPCPLDKVNRQFHAPAPNRLWVSDFTYVATWAGFVYVAFVIDAYPRSELRLRVAEIQDDVERELLAIFRRFSVEEQGVILNFFCLVVARAEPTGWRHSMCSRCCPMTCRQGAELSELYG